MCSFDLSGRWTSRHTANLPLAARKKHGKVGQRGNFEFRLHLPHQEGVAATLTRDLVVDLEEVRNIQLPIAVASGGLAERSRNAALAGAVLASLG